MVSAALMTVTGALEGVIVGLAQWSVLRRAIAGVSRRTWVAATVIGAVIAWLCSSIPMTMASLSADNASPAMQEPSQAVVLLMASGLGLVAGLVLSAAQWAALRGHVGRAWRWLPANALAWAAGMPLIFAGIDLAQKGGSALAGVLVMGATIAIAGAVVGAVHGIALVAFAAESRGRHSTIT